LGRRRPGHRAAPHRYPCRGADARRPRRRGVRIRPRPARPAGPRDRRLRRRCHRAGTRVPARERARTDTGPGGGPVMSPVSTRLVRLLNMVPYFQVNQRITFAEASADLGVSRRQLEADLNQLWMCGLPGYGPGDLIDIEFSGDTIEVVFS